MNFTQPDTPDHEDSPAEWLFSARSFGIVAGRGAKTEEIREAYEKFRELFI